jgi:SsrA-binding protein
MDLIQHKKARFDYEILEEFEAGIELIGLEVKSLRTSQAKLEGSHVIVRGGEAYVVGMVISPYQPTNTPEGYDPNRVRKLLLTKKEIEELAKYEGQKGLTIVPISVYNKGRNLKMRVAVARGRKKYDKREVIKKRETDIDIRRTLKRE